MNYLVAISNSNLEPIVCHFDGDISIGERVLINYKKRKVVGYVIKILKRKEFSQESLFGKSTDEPSHIFEILERLDYVSFIDEQRVSVIINTAMFYGSGIGRYFDLSFPPEFDNYFSLFAEGASPLVNIGKMPYEEFKKMKNFNQYISNNLVRIYRDFETKKPKPRKVTQYVILKLPSNKLTSMKLTARQSVVVNYLLFNGSGFCNLDQLIEDTDISKDIIVQLVNKGVVEISEHAPTSTLEEISKSISKVGQKTVLTEEQANVAKNILSHHVGEKHLLFGPTGSGKTEVYLKVMEEYLPTGTVLYLVPEVSLTEQTVARIRSKFPHLSVGIYHSYMSKSKRVEIWAKAVKGELDILVGARSAVFVPLKNLKLVIVDEEHDESYYNDNEPYYDVHTLLDQLPATVVYGSATPALSSYKKALDGIYVLNKLTKRYSTDLPNVEIVDMKNEKKITPSISQKLAEGISDTLAANKSVIIFTRRKGFSRVQCAVCGYIVKCDHCDVSMTYHLDLKKLACHLCGNIKELNFTCPNCGASLFVDKGTGTEKVEKELKEIFPGRSIARIDAEIIDKFEKLSKILSALREGNVDILAGTKMITKGLDIYRIGLVGVIDVDALISYPDINASLRTFQLLVQVVGRAGRKEKGRAVIQTYNPKDPVISYAVAQDVEAFYNRELRLRRELKYPPFLNVIQVTYANLDNNLARDTLDTVAGELETFLYQLSKEYQENGEYNEEYNEEYKDIEILGPSEHPILKVANKYRYQLIIKTHNTINLLKLLRKIIAPFPGEWTIKVNPPEI